MARLVKCDMCGGVRIVPTDEVGLYSLNVYKRATATHSSIVMTLDICERCFNRVKERADEIRSEIIRGNNIVED